MVRSTIDGSKDHCSKCGEAGHRKNTCGKSRAPITLGRRKHGTASMYVGGCRCADCAEAQYARSGVWAYSPQKIEALLAKARQRVAFYEGLLARARAKRKVGS